VDNYKKKGWKETTHEKDGDGKNVDFEKIEVLKNIFGKKDKGDY